MFKDMFECSPIAKILVDEKSCIHIVNKAAETLFQYSRKELIGESVNLLVPFEIRDQHLDFIKQYFLAPLPRKMGVGRTLIGIKKDQSQFPVEVALNPIHTDNQLFVMSAIIDITERIRSEERFKSAVDAAPSGMLMINQKGKIVLVNKKIELIFGYEKHELINKPIEILVPNEFKKHHPILIQSFFQQLEPRMMGAGRDLFGKHKSGKLIPVEVGLQSLHFEEGVFVISSVVDISHRKEIEAEVKMKSEELVEFSYRTSHDLKSPLLTIEGLADCAIEDLQVDKNIKEALFNLKNIKEVSKNLSQLIDDILTLTKTDIVKEEKQKFDFDSYIEIAEKKFQYLLTKNKVSLSYSSLQEIDLFIEKTRLIQVLDNLISNGIKYYNPSIKNRTVKVIAFKDQDCFHIQVEDNGIGIPVDKHSEVFSMFKKLHNKNIPGSGLGLYIVKKQIQKLHATISFESSTNGTIFYIKFNKNMMQEKT